MPMTNRSADARGDDTPHVGKVAHAAARIQLSVWSLNDIGANDINESGDVSTASRDVCKRPKRPGGNRRELGGV